MRALEREAHLRDLRDQARAPGLGDDRLDEQVAPRLERVGHAAEHLGPLGGRHARPRAVVERAPRGGDRVVDLLERRRLHVGERSFGRRVLDRERARGSRHEGAVDERAPGCDDVSHAEARYLIFDGPSNAG